MGTKSLTEYRDVNITITGAPMPIDAYASIIGKVRQLECNYENSLDDAGVTDLVDLAAEKCVATANHMHQIYIFDLTTVYATGEYTFDFLEVARNTEEATVL